MEMIYKKDFQYIIQKIPLDRFEGSSWLITGASGFIMSYFIRFIIYLNENCLKNKCQLILVCRNKNKLLKRIGAKSIPSNIYILEQDINDKISLDIEVDYVIHGASISSTKFFEIYPTEVMMANSIGLNNVCNLFINKNVKAILFLSSGAVYGDIPYNCKELVEDSAFPLDFMKIKNCYAESKRFGELLMKSYFKEYGMPCKSVRISHTYGPGIDLEDGHVYSDFVKALLLNQDIVLRGDGSDIRPFCYIADAIVAFIYILLYGEDGEAYNMANNHETYSIYDLATLLISHLSSEKNICVKRNIIRDIRKQEMTYVNVEKLENLGWNPEIDVITGFNRTLQSFKDE